MIEDLRAIFVGNDPNDLPVFEMFGIKAASADTEKEILDTVDWVFER